MSGSDGRGSIYSDERGSISAFFPLKDDLKLTNAKISDFVINNFVKQISIK